VLSKRGTKGEKKQEKRGRSPGHDLPLEKHPHRKGAPEAIDSRLERKRVARWFGISCVAGHQLFHFSPSAS